MSVKRNSVYNLIGSVIPLAVSIFTIPLYLKLIGEARYGVLAIAWLLLGYFGIFDLGLGRATAQRIAELKNSNALVRAQTFWTAFTLNVSLGVLGGLLVWPVANLFFSDVLSIDTELRLELQAAIPWLVLAVPMATLSGVLGGALQGAEKFFESNVVSVAGAALFQLLPLSMALLGYIDLGVLLPAALFARFLTLCVLYQRCWRHIFRGFSVAIDFAQCSQLLRFGGWVTVSAFLNPIMTMLDRFIIGALLGAKAVSYYTIPFQLSERTTILSGSLTSALFPRFAAVSDDEAKRLASDGLQILNVVVTPLIVLGILLLDPLLAWWITPEFSSHSALVGKIILIGFWINGFSKIPYASLQAKGRPDLVAKCHMIEVVPYLLMLYLGLRFFGLEGAAMAFGLRMIVDFGLLLKFSNLDEGFLGIFALPTVFIIGAFFVSNSIFESFWQYIFSLLIFSLVAFWSCFGTSKNLKLLVSEGMFKK
jgi:O-antigen/teichoic acid export membrane protein